MRTGTFMYACIHVWHIYPSTAGQLYAMALTPLVGWLTDRIGVGRVTLLGAASIALCGLPVYYALPTGGLGAVVLHWGFSCQATGTPPGSPRSAHPTHSCWHLGLSDNGRKPLFGADREPREPDGGGGDGDRRVRDGAGAGGHHGVPVGAGAVRDIGADHRHGLLPLARSRRSHGPHTGINVSDSVFQALRARNYLFCLSLQCTLLMLNLPAAPMLQTFGFPSSLSFMSGKLIKFFVCFGQTTDEKS